MKLKGIEFGRVLCASGARGFFGEGYWFHPLLRPFGLNWDGSGFTAKTTTLLHNKGNMALKNNFTPRDFFPDCIKVYPLKGIALNAVGLSGPGAKALFMESRWQKLTDPFFLSFMSTAKSPEMRLAELTHFLGLLNGFRSGFQAPIGLQINYSCPNIEHRAEIDHLMKEIDDGLSIAGRLGIPIVPKISVLFPPKLAAEIASHQYCDALCVSNTIPYGEMPESIPWKNFFGSALRDESPLAKYRGGGLSGKPLLLVLRKWLMDARTNARITKPINAGGGILSVSDAKDVFSAMGDYPNPIVDSIFLGSIAFLRPWRVRGIIEAVNSW